MKRKTAFVLLVGLLICACAGRRAEQIQAKAETWKGKHFNDLVAALGPPSQVMDDGGNGRIFVYSASRQIYLPGNSWTTSQGNITRQGDIYMSSKGVIPGRTYTSSESSDTFTTPGYSFTRAEHTMYWINTEGYIYRTAYSGSKGTKRLKALKSEK